MRQTDRDVLGNYLSQKTYEDPSFVIGTCQTLKDEVDEILGFIRQRKAKPMDHVAYQEFWQRINTYYIPHITVKYIVDYLDPTLLEKSLHNLEEARVYAEPVFAKTEELIVGLATTLSKKYDYRPELMLCMVKEEFYDCLNGQAPPARSLLEERYVQAAILADRKECFLLVGDKAKDVDNIVTPKLVTDTIKGSVAYKGKVKGTVRIILDPTKADHFQRGDILVTGMTRPEYLPIMHKAAAFVTDAGGILSHAAITARELKKPCVIGTQIASKVLKDGDVVEVDADNGIVKKVEH